MKGCAIVVALLLVLAGLGLFVSRLGESDDAGVRVPTAERPATERPTAERPATEPRADAGAIEERPADQPAPRIDAAEQGIFDATNDQRARHGLPPLAPEATLRRAARAHSADMLARGFFSHDNPDGASAGDRIATRHRRLVGLAGENIWTGSGYGATPAAELARTIVEGWMSSPGHRANILRPEFTHLGVGIAAVGQEVRATQNFATVFGFTSAPVPAKIGRGARLAPGPVSGPRGAAELFDLFAARRGVTAGPFPVGGAAIDAAAGSYRLRFYFPEGSRRYTIVEGPRIEVRR